MKRGKKILKSAETRLRFSYSREPIRARFVTESPRMRHSSDPHRQKHRRALGYLWKFLDPSSDQWIRGRIRLGTYDPSSDLYFSALIAETAIFKPFLPFSCQFQNTLWKNFLSILTSHAHVIYQKYNIQSLKTHQTHLHCKSRGEVLWSFLHFYTKMALLGIKCTSNESMSIYKHVITKTHLNILKMQHCMYAWEF